MAKTRSVFVCNTCGAQSPKWAGQCTACGAWNALTETVVVAHPAAMRSGASATTAGARPQPLKAIEPDRIARLATGSGELDRVLGGGLVAGSVVLLGGDPGIGKSTLLLQALADISQRAAALYVSGEESADQIALRAKRLGVAAGSLNLLTDNQVEQIIAELWPAVSTDGTNYPVIQTLDILG